MSGKNLITLVLLVIAVTLGASSVYYVDQREKAIVFQFGEIVRSNDEPGIHFKAPLINNVRFFDARVSIEGWIAERADLNALLMEMRAKDIIVNDESQSPEVKMLSMQMVVLAKMINLTHKNLL